MGFLFFLASYNYYDGFLAALRGAAVLNARVLRDTESIRSHIPCDSGDDNNSLINSVRDSPSDDSEVECGNLEFLSRGCEFLKRTRKGKNTYLALLPLYK